MIQELVLVDELHKIKKLLNEILKLEKRIMSAISDFAIAQNEFNDQMDASIADLQGDIQSLNDEITKLKDSLGGVTPEDQALLDALLARGQAIADKLAALDALTPPAVPDEE
jgi:chromosome segregation ATPase